MLTRTSCIPILLLAAAGCSSTTIEGDYGVTFSEGAQTSTVLDSKLRHLEKMAEEYPKRSDIPFQMAGVYYQKEAYRDSARALERAIYIDPGQAKYHYHLGRVYLLMRELEPAEREFRKAVEMMPSDRYTGAHGALGYVLCQQGRWEEALKEYETCIGIDPKEPNPHYFLGCVQDVLRNRERAVEAFRAYLRLGGNEYRSTAIKLLLGYGVMVTREELEAADRPRQPAEKEETALGEEIETFHPPVPVPLETPLGVPRNP